MKYLTLRNLDYINRALVFDTPDCRILGGCEIYTTKAAGSDKKLYKNISSTLTSRYEADVRLSESFSPPADSGSYQSRSLYESLHSPFGPLNQVAAQKTFAYMIATLNASHPDYDFSTVLRPSDFRRERSLNAVMNSFNTSLFGLGFNVNQKLPMMWETIDSEMDLRDCSIYSYKPGDPSDDPYGEDGLIWSNVLFFFNKNRKRVCYMYLRGISTISHSPPLDRGAWVDSKTGVNYNGWSSEDSEESDDFSESRSIWGDMEDDGMFENMEI